MHPPREALQKILDRVEPLAETERVPIDDALARVLAADVRSDIDLPPFEKSAMDGYAVRSVDFRSGATDSDETTLRLVGESRAGTPWDDAVGAGECVAIYTGAELPPGTDAVVMVEKTRREADCVVLADQPGSGQHVCHRGEELTVDDLVLALGRRISAVDLATLASVGCDPVPVFRRPRVALATTGDELVPPSTKPGRGQIREGNTRMLRARLGEHGADVESLGVLRDDPAELERELGAALERCDALVTTGGVSMGRYDLVGDALERLGVELVLHKVAIKPGKPVWFGMKGRVPVFGLPGNPVSSLVGAEVFVRPALAKLEGAAAAELEERLLIGRWIGDERRGIGRQQNLPVTVTRAADGVEELTPVTWRGSADVVGLGRADGLAVLEPDTGVRPGGLVSYRPLDSRMRR